MVEHSVVLRQFHDQILDLINENGWRSLLVVEMMEDAVTQGVVRVSLGAGHLTSPGEIVNEYLPHVNPLEQVQQECLRALRTGRPGI